MSDTRTSQDPVIDPVGFARVPFDWANRLACKELTLHIAMPA